MMKKMIYWGIALLLLLQPLYSQSVRATIESAEVYIGQPFEYRIIIEGSTDTARPDLPAVPGMDMVYKGASTSVVSSFGTGGNSSSKTVTHSWLFTAHKAGSIRIPSFTISIDGKDYSTASGSITVKNPESIEGFHLIMETDKDQYWTGEPIMLTIRWLFSTSVSNPVFTIPFISSGDFKAESQNPPPGSDVYRINIDGMEVLTMQSAEIYKGKQYSTLSFQVKLIPQQTGGYDLEPLTLAFDKAERSNGFRTTYKSVVIPSNSLSLNINSLPPEADPDIILSRGTLVVSSKADPLKVHLGDPLTYSITINGAAVPEAVKLAPLSEFGSFAEIFSVPEKRSVPNIEGDSVTFSQTIRVKKEGVKEIPALQLPYFNIESGSIEYAFIPAIPLEVMETQIVTSEDLEATGYSGRDVPVVRSLEDSEGGLFHNFSVQDILDGGSNRSAARWLFLLLPIILFISTAVYRYRKNLYTYILSLKGDNEDFREIYQQLKESDDETVLEALKSYLSDYCQMDGTSLTPFEIYDCLIKTDTDNEVCLAIRNLLCSLEESIYSMESHEAISESLDSFYALSKELK